MLGFCKIKLVGIVIVSCFLILFWSFIMFKELKFSFRIDLLGFKILEVFSCSIFIVNFCKYFIIINFCFFFEVVWNFLIFIIDEGEIKFFNFVYFWFDFVIDFNCCCLSKFSIFGINFSLFVERLLVFVSCLVKVFVVVFVIWEIVDFDNFDFLFFI